MEEPEAAYDMLQSMLTDVSIHPQSEDSKISPSFEGNQGILGVTAGITEILMQSHSNEISILPALPVERADGGIQGLRAKGGFRVNVFWSKGKLSRALIHSVFDRTCVVCTKIPVRVFSGDREVNLVTVQENVISFNAKAGEDYAVIAL